MGTGELNIRLNFIEGYGYGDEPYIVFNMPGSSIEPLLIWEGLFADLLDNPDMSGKGWIGFTRDYHELKGIWNEDYEPVSIDVSEYLKDLDYYTGQSFKFEETAEMFEALRKYLEYAQRNGYQISAHYDDLY
ncbi:hypothetical protein IJT17_03475 [bacterium]|nr:hypothetical protein [bacterium]